MTGTKAEIIARLQKEILPLQGFRPALSNAVVDTGIGRIKEAFPDATFPVGAIHEFISESPEDAAATSGFVAGILGALMKHNGAVIWISTCRTIFPPALSLFGIAPDRIIFIDVRNQRALQWTIEEALKCDGLAAVVGEMPELSFKASRRLQLAVEQSKVTGFILRHSPRCINITACISRWKITSLPGETDGLPGVGFPGWQVELLKVRNGRPGSWQVQFAGGRFRHLSKISVIHRQIQKKAV